MDRIRTQLDKLTELSAAELDELEGGVVEAFKLLDEADTLTRDSVDNMNELASAADVIREERSRREQEAAELSAARDEAARRVSGEPAAEDASVENEPVATDTDEDAGEPDVSEEGENVGEDTDETADTEDAAKDEDEKAAKKKAYSAEDAATLSTETPDAAELAVDQPAVQPEEIKDAPEVGKPDEEIVVQETGEAGQAKHPSNEDVVQEKDTAGVETAQDDGQAEADAKDETEKKTTSKSKKSEETTVTASGEPGALEVPDDRQPVVKTAPVAITAGADIPGVTAGSELPNMRSVADAMVKRMHAMGRTSGGDGEQHTIATLTASFPEDRILHTNDFEGNSRKVADIVEPTAIVAAGGLCAPVEVSYDIFGLEGSTSRPVRDALAMFSADRGGIRFVTPPTLSDLNGAVSLWTLQDDIDAATAGAPDPVKPCLRVNCGNEVVVYTDAIPLCLTFGNLNARAWPELVARHMELAMVQHARYSETRLLTRIGSLSTAVSAAQRLSAARDFFVQLDQAAAGYRNRHRMDPQSPLRVILPEWFRNMLRADLTMQLPGDGQDATFGLADNFMANWFSVRHINPSWTLDGESGQILGAQNAGALNAFPSQVIWYLFAEGTFLFLDGGTLDLGLVRDSTLNGTNDYKVFLETFEGVAKVGIESLKITSQMRVAGASASTVTTV